MKNGNSDEAVDAIARERMRLAGLHVPGEVSKEREEWDRKVLKENRSREMASELLLHHAITVEAAFAKAEAFVELAFKRMEELQRAKPYEAGSAILDPTVHGASS